jgi:hypothetical protein
MYFKIKGAYAPMCQNITLAYALIKWTDIFLPTIILGLSFYTAYLFYLFLC